MLDYDELMISLVTICQHSRIFFSTVSKPPLKITSGWNILCVTSYVAPKATYWNLIHDHLHLYGPTILNWFFFFRSTFWWVSFTKDTSAWTVVLMQQTVHANYTSSSIPFTCWFSSSSYHLPSWDLLTSAFAVNSGLWHRQENRCAADLGKYMVFKFLLLAGGLLIYNKINAGGIVVWNFWVKRHVEHLSKLSCVKYRQAQWR